MQAIIVTAGTAEEIAALARAVQKRQETHRDEREHLIQVYECELYKLKDSTSPEREQLIREYERRLDKLKSGASIGDVV